MKPQNLNRSEKPPRGGGASTILKSGAALALCLTIGCGTTSSLKGVQGTSKVDLSGDTKVVVQNLADEASRKEKPEKREQQEKQMTAACREFADRLARGIEQQQVFEAVTRSGADAADESTLVVGGHISRFDEGSPAARFWVGMGAGSSYFDALLEFRQGKTGLLLATVEVDKNSWVLGGAIASSQTPEGFMAEAAKKIADEMVKAKGAQAKAKTIVK